jgi:hypothetical protein
VTPSKIRLLVRSLTLGATAIISALGVNIPPEAVAGISAAVEGVLQVFVKDSPGDLCEYCDEVEDA